MPVLSEEVTTIAEAVGVSVGADDDVDVVEGILVVNAVEEVLTSQCGVAPQ